MKGVFMRYILALALVLVFSFGVSSLAIADSSGGGNRPITLTQLWAVVNVNGSLARGSGALSSQQLGVDGQYRVTFVQDVSHCAYVGGAGEATTFPPDDAITIGASSSLFSTKAVEVIEYDAILGYDSYSSGFHLLVLC
jgi:hypothetical protein